MLCGRARPEDPIPQHTDNARGILFMCLAMAVFIVSDTAMKVASTHVSVGQAILLRGLIASALALALVASRGALADLRHVAHPLVALRSVLEGLIAVFYIGALALMPISIVTALFLVSPLMITAAGAVFLGERVRWRRALAVVVGFIGMLVVIRPAGGGLNAGVWLVLAATVLVVARDLVTRRIPSGVPSLAATVGTIVIATMVGGVLALAQPWRPVGMEGLVPLAIAALAVTAGNYAIIVAFRSGEVSVVSPFRYTMMVWAVVAGVLVFGHWPDGPTWAGIALITGAGLYTLYREAILMRRSPG